MEPKYFLWTVLGTALPLVVGAPTVSRSSNPAETQSTSIVYESVFADYRSYAETDIANWREVNDAVRPTAADSGAPSHVEHGNSPAVAPPPNISGHTARGSSGQGAHGSHSANPAHSGHGDATRDARHGVTAPAQR